MIRHLQNDTWASLIEGHLKHSRKPLIVIVGPTASGKTDFSLEVAKSIEGAEIVNGDSRQLYRHLSIGTAKIMKEEMLGIPHHLFDVLDPNEEVTISWYKEHATKVIDEIQARGGVPIIVGGSMLYISSIIDGLEPIPTDKKLRVQLEAEYEIDAGASLYKKLQELDPESAAGIHVHNKPYVIRAMEIQMQTGESASKAKSTSKPPYDLLIFGMEWPREELKERIEQRTKELFKRGWMEEVRQLREKGYLSTDPAMKSHGYREIMDHLEGSQMTQEQLVQSIARKSSAYAKRQMTWWKHDPRIHWIGGPELI